jgi:peptidoglycan-N-acetylglucosamine deacetylase
MHHVLSFFELLHFFNLVFKAPSQKKTVAITFDDGPHPSQTPLILELLAQHNFKATFFMTSTNMRRNKDLLRTVAASGHEIANHTCNHPNNFFLNRTRLFAEINDTKKFIEDFTGKPNRFFRPPYGLFTPSTFSICKQLNLTIVLWNINSFDYKCPGVSHIANRVISRIKPGDICLFHDCHFRDTTKIYSQTISALKTVLPFAAGKGLKCITIGELLSNSANTYPTN